MHFGTTLKKPSERPKLRSKHSRTPTPLIRSERAQRLQAASTRLAAWQEAWAARRAEQAEVRRGAERGDTGRGSNLGQPCALDLQAARRALRGVLPSARN